jgi:hypothetical protein
MEKNVEFQHYLGLNLPLHAMSLWCSWQPNTMHEKTTYLTQSLGLKEHVYRNWVSLFYLIPDYYTGRCQNQKV